MASSSLEMTNGRLSRWLTRNLLTSLVVSVLSSMVKRVFATMSDTSASVCGSVLSRKMNPLRVVANEEGGGVKGMNIVVTSFVDMNL